MSNKKIELVQGICFYGIRVEGNIIYWCASKDIAEKIIELISEDDVFYKLHYKNEYDYED